MLGHGAVGRTFAGRIVQLITGSTGLDDWEWGVTLFGVHPDDLKACVYEMRFDEASAHYAEFGPFWTGMVGGIDDVRSRRLAGSYARPPATTDAGSPTARSPRGTSSAPACRDARTRPARGGLQRRGRLGPPGLGRHRRPRARCVLCVTAVSPSLAPGSRPTARRWPRSGGCAGAPCRRRSSTIRSTWPTAPTAATTAERGSWRRSALGGSH